MGLGRTLSLTESQAAALESDIHDALEEVLAPYFAAPECPPHGCGDAECGEPCEAETVEPGLGAVTEADQAARREALKADPEYRRAADHADAQGGGTYVE